MLNDPPLVRLLSAKIMTKEPHAAVCITNAFNNAHDLALQTSEITAFKCLTGAVMVEKSSTLSNKVYVEQLRDTVKESIGQMAFQDGFLSVAALVIFLGGTHTSTATRFYRSPRQRSIRSAGGCQCTSTKGYCNSRKSVCTSQVPS